MSSFDLFPILLLSSLLILFFSYRLVCPFSKVIVNGKPVNGLSGFLLSTFGLLLGVTVGLIVIGLIIFLVVGLPILVASILLLVLVAILLFIFLSPLLILMLMFFGIGSKTISAFSKK